MWAGCIKGKNHGGMQRVWMFALLLLMFCGKGSADTLRVAVATNFNEPMTALSDLFETHSGHELIPSSGSSGALYAQIRNGAPYHVFLAADAHYPARLEDEGLAVAGSRFTYAEGRLALWRPGRTEADPGMLRDPDFRFLALANPRLAPYGLAARETLEHLGLWETLRGKIVLGENIGQAYAMVATGNAEVGFVALSQLRQTRQARYWLVPRELHSAILQQAVMLQPGKETAAAAAFLEFLQGEHARSIIRRFGYNVE